MKARFSPQVINQLRHRVISFNETLDDASRETSLLKLQNLKTLYKRWHNGADPHAHALAKIDAYLDDLRKAQEPFNPAEHPRGQRGQFSDVGTRQAHEDLADENAGYAASQTQVIPETRYTTLGRPIAGAAGLGLGAITGANARVTGPGTPLDRLQTRLAGRIGAKAGDIVGTLGAAPVRLAGRGVRAGIGLINRTTQSTYRRPGPTVGDELVFRAGERGAKIGGSIGRGISRAQIIAMQALPAAARAASESVTGPGLRGRLLSHTSGGIVGAATTGTVIAGSLMLGVDHLGPWLDAAFPRHVRKADLAWMNAPEVLAKQHELMNDDLAKANLGAAAHAALAAARGLSGRVSARAGRIIATLRPSVASHTIGPAAAPASAAAPSSIGGAAAHHVFGLFGARPPVPGQFTVKAERGGRAIATTLPAAALGVLGGGTGAILGAAGVGAHDFLFAGKHPRDPKGRFATKAKASKQGAALGGALGTGVGLAIGLAAAKRGHGALLANALKRLGEAVPEMHAETEKIARQNHAVAFWEHKPNHALMPDAALGPSGDVTPGQIIQSLKAHAKDVWMKTYGPLHRAGPVAWYSAQIDAGFDRTAANQLHGVRGPAGEITPLRDHAGETIPRSAAHDLINELDPEQLNENQRKIWDHLVTRRQTAIDNLQGLYEGRQKLADTTAERLRDLEAENTKLDSDLVEVPRQRAEHLHNALREVEHLAADPESSHAQIAAAAKVHFNHTLLTEAPGIRASQAVKNVRRMAAVNEIKAVAADFEKRQVDELRDWTAKANARSDEIGAELPTLRAELKTARERTAQDIAAEETQHMAVRNPFPARRGTDAFLQPMESIKTHTDRIEAAASRDFEQEGNRHANEAKEHLNTIIAAHQAGLEARIPQTGWTEAQVRRFAPVLAGHLQEAFQSYNRISGANAEALTGWQKQTVDWLRQHRNPKAAYAAAKDLGNKAAVKAEGVSAWAFRNWKSIATAVGLANTVGAIDLNAPPGKRWKINPGTWKRPADLQPIIEFPDPIKRPNEAVLGLSFRDKAGQQRFLHGVHITGADGRHSNLPVGVSVSSIVQSVRNADRSPGGSGTNAKPLKVKDEAALNAKIKQLDAHISNVGPPSMQFRQLASNQTGGKEADDFIDEFTKEHLKYLIDHPHLNNTSTNRDTNYWDALDQLFSGNSQILTNSQRALLLIGAKGGKRGMFPPNAPWFGNDKDKIVQAMISQVKHQGGPNTTAKYRQLARAFWVIGQHFGLNEAQIQRATLAAVKATENSGTEVSGQSSEKAGSLARVREVEELAMAQFPSRTGILQDDNDLRQYTREYYQRHVSHMRAAGATNEDDIHDQAKDEALSTIRQLVKTAPTGSLRKFLTYDQPATGLPPKRPRVPPIAGAMSSRPPSMRPPAVRPPAMGAPPIAGAGAGAAPPGGGGNLATRLGVRHQLSQVGSYGLSQAAYEGVEAIANQVLPGAGIAARTGKFLLPAAASYVGSVHAGPALGGALGRRLGDTGKVGDARDDNELAARSVGGGIAQLGATKLASTAAGKRVVGAAGQAISGAAGKVAGRVADSTAGKAVAGTFERLGAKWGGRVGQVAGFGAGEVADPAGGGLAGRIAGKVGGVAIGAGAGWLADEGIGLLYRHLGHYGQHVPDLAAKSLGHHR